MKKDCEMVMQDPLHNMRTTKKYSYVFTLCKKDGSEVLAVRKDYYARGLDARREVLEEYPDWNIKNILKLYDSDFE